MTRKTHFQCKIDNSHHYSIYIYTIKSHISSLNLFRKIPYFEKNENDKSLKNFIVKI